MFIIKDNANIDPSVFLNHGETFGGFNKKQQADKALEFFFNNIPVWEKFHELSVFVKEREGKDKLGVAFIWNQLRWYYYFELKQREVAFKLNNNYTPFYARVFNSQLENAEMPAFYNVRTSLFDSLDLSSAYNTDSGGQFWVYLRRFWNPK